MKIAITDDAGSPEILALLKNLPKSVKGKIIVRAVKKYVENEAGREALKVLVGENWESLMNTNGGKKSNSTSNDNQKKGRREGPLGVLGDFGEF